jgi:hypothetical protein
MQINYINQFDEKGYCEIKNFINDNEINILKKFVNKNLSQNKFNSFFLSSKSNNNIDKFFIKHKQIEKKLIKILIEISNKLGVVHLKSKKPYYVLRVLHKKRIEQESLNFHFDSHLITVLIPIIIPKRKNSNNGHFLMIPHKRKITTSIFKNIIQKIFYQKIIGFFLKKFRSLISIYGFKKVILKPGSLFLFNGFRTLHGNLDIDIRDTRATFLVHFYDIFEKSKLVKFNRNLRIKKENKIINKNLNND